MCGSSRSARRQIFSLVRFLALTKTAEIVRRKKTTINLAGGAEPPQTPPRQAGGAKPPQTPPRQAGGALPPQTPLLKLKISAGNFLAEKFSAENFSVEKCSAEKISAENFSAEKISAEKNFDRSRIGEAAFRGGSGGAGAPPGPFF